MTPLGYVSSKLKVLEHERKAFLEEQDKNEEQFRCLEEERQFIIEMERESHQEAHNLLMAAQINNQFNNVYINGGNNSPPLTPPKSP